MQWHCLHSMRGRVYETVRCLSIYPSICLSQHQPTAENPLLQVCCSGPSGEETSIDWCSSGVRRANAGSATLSAYVCSWTQTCSWYNCTQCFHVAYLFFSCLQWLIADQRPVFAVLENDPYMSGHYSLMFGLVFTARCYASAVLAMGLCPCLCLCLSVSVCHKPVFY